MPETQTFMLTVEHLRAAGAVFSPCQRYRYALWRDEPTLWAHRPHYVAFIGLNPSTADATRDDPTIRRCRGFARRLGYSAFAMLNLFAFRATRPADLYQATDPIGRDTDAWLTLLYTQAAVVVACWGAGGRYQHRGRCVRQRYSCLYCFGTTQAGEPRHPLYLSSDTPIVSLSQPLRPEERGFSERC